LSQVFLNIFSRCSRVAAINQSIIGFIISHKITVIVELEVLCTQR
jgi:hypothetical protein